MYGEALCQSYMQIKCFLFGKRFATMAPQKQLQYAMNLMCLSVSASNSM